jgi:hypothetical protein
VVLSSASESDTDADYRTGEKHDTQIRKQPIQPKTLIVKNSLAKYFEESQPVQSSTLNTPRETQRREPLNQDSENKRRKSQRISRNLMGHNLLQLHKISGV